MCPLIPAVTHADSTGRLQTVSAANNGVPMVLNTSYEPPAKPSTASCAPAWMCWCWGMSWYGAARAAVREARCCDVGPGRQHRHR